VRYCGVTPVGAEHLQLVTLEEVRVPEPPVQMHALFYEPGSAAQVAAELNALEQVVVAIAAPAGTGRVCDRELEQRGVPSTPPSPETHALYIELEDLARFTPPAAGPGVVQGDVPEGAFASAPLLETNTEGIFYSLQGRRLPSRRHPFGMELRIGELTEGHVLDEGGDLWHRRIEEVEAAAAALCAHRYAVGHAGWVGDPSEGVIVLPGSTLPEHFDARGTVPPVERVPLGPPG
jgi:hypothetical protein